MFPLVTIIIPCYNYARFIHDALDSALAQDYDPLEIIVVNDGSTDDFEARLVPYQNHPRITIITQENRGLPATRNRGIQEARGEYLKFLDADDWLARETISKQVAAFQNSPALGLVYCDLIRVNARGEQIDDYSVATARSILNGDILPSLLVGGYFTPHTVLVPRCVLDHVGEFNETLKGVEDTEMWMRIMCEGYAAYFVPEKLAYYRLHGTNLSFNTPVTRPARQRILDLITTRYPHRVAAALDELIAEHQRADRDQTWAHETIAAQQAQIDSQQRALNTRGVRAIRAVEHWLKR